MSTPTIDTPIWLLDVDGVINVTRPAWNERPHQGHAYYEGNEYRIRWSPTLVNRIKAIANAGTASVMWCSTWAPAIEQIERLLRFPKLHAVFSGPPLFNDRIQVIDDDRKLGVAALIARSGCRLIWTDDTAVPEPGVAAHHLFTATGRNLLVKPAGNRGLTPQHLDQIEAFIGAGNGNQAQGS